MLRASLLARRSVAYERKLRRKFRSGAQLPMEQTFKQRQDTIDSVAKHRHIGRPEWSEKRRRDYAEARLYSSGARAERQGVQTNRTYALQGLGDTEPLQGSAQFGISEATSFKYDNKAQMARYEAPPAPYSALAARKLAEGKFWPSAPEPTNLTSREVVQLRHEKNMSPSALKFTAQIEYYLRRDLKACPGHIAERLDFAQLIIKEVLASRRSTQIYIVWTTVHPGARFEMEPHLLKLGSWVRQMIFRRIKLRPNIPRVSWVYDAGTLQRELPRDLKQKLEAVLSENASTLEDRVEYLKKMDSVDAKMKSIPWFMPYLWSKDKKMMQRREMLADVKEMDARRSEHRQGGAPSDDKPHYVS